MADQLRELGVDAASDDVVTSAQAAARLLLDQHGAGARVAVLGADGLLEALREAGLEPVPVGADDAVAVVSGYAPEVRWKTIMRAAVEIRNGLAVGGHEHRSDPPDRGRTRARSRHAREDDQRLRRRHPRRGRQAGAAPVRGDPAAGGRRPAADGRRQPAHRHRGCAQRRDRLVAGDDGRDLAVRPGRGPSRPAAHLGGERPEGARSPRLCGVRGRRQRGRPEDGRRRCRAAGSRSTAPETRRAGGRWSARQPGRISTRPARRPTCRTCPLPVRTPPRGSLRP